MDSQHFYPENFENTPAIEHDADHLAIFVDQPLATYVFDQGYIDQERLDEMEVNGYFLVTRIKKNTKFHVLESLETGEQENILLDQLVVLGSSPFRLITLLDEKGTLLRFVTSHFDVTAQEIAEMYKMRWQIELFFKHIKQHMTLKKLFSRSQQGVTNQLILAIIASLLTYLIQVETGTKKTSFQIKRLLRHLLFQPFDVWFRSLVPT